MVLSVTKKLPGPSNLARQIELPIEEGGSEVYTRKTFAEPVTYNFRRGKK